MAAGHVLVMTSLLALSAAQTTSVPSSSRQYITTSCSSAID